MKEFIKRMQIELENNSRKGDWEKFAVKENRKDIVDEISHHLNKLNIAVYEKDEELIKEYSADIANIAMFMFNTTK